MAQPNANCLVPPRARGHSLASFRRLRIRNCGDIFLGSWPRLRSGIAAFLWSEVTFSCQPLGGCEG